MNHLYAGVLIAIVLGLLTVSISRLRKTRTKADYLVAGRSLPAVVLVFTLLCSWIGSGSLLGAAENAYNHGFAALWQAGGGLLIARRHWTWDGWRDYQGKRLWLIPNEVGGLTLMFQEDY